MILNSKKSGKRLPTLTNPGVASDLASGKQMIGADGELVTGTGIMAVSDLASLRSGYFTQTTENIVIDFDEITNISVDEVRVIQFYTQWVYSAIDKGKVLSGTLCRVNVSDSLKFYGYFIIKGEAAFSFGQSRLNASIEGGKLMINTTEFFEGIGSSIANVRYGFYLYK